MTIKGFGNPGEGIEAVLGTASFFEARDHGLGGSHSFREGRAG